MSTKNKFSTRCVHDGEIKDTMYQGIVSPLFMSTTYPWFGGDAEKKPYPRYFNTPNQEFLSKKIASLENGEKALINTSFNAHEQPIIISPDLAIKCLIENRIDILVLSNYIVKRV